LRNADGEIPMLGMWLQQRYHSLLPRAPMFDNQPSAGREAFLTLEAAQGFDVDVPGLPDRLHIRGEAGAQFNSFQLGARAFALVEAELGIGGGFALTARQSAQILSGQNFSFETLAGAKLELPWMLIGIEAEVPSGDLQEPFTLHNDRDARVRFRLGVGL
jgi:hypothetical protein